MFLMTKLYIELFYKKFTYIIYASVAKTRSFIKMVTRYFVLKNSKHPLTDWTSRWLWWVFLLSYSFGSRRQPSSLHFLAHFINHVCNPFQVCPKVWIYEKISISQYCSTLTKKGRPLSFLSNRSTPWRTGRIP